MQEQHSKLPPTDVRAESLRKPEWGTTLCRDCHGRLWTGRNLNWALKNSSVKCFWGTFKSMAVGGSRWERPEEWEAGLRGEWRTVSSGCNFWHSMEHYGSSADMASCSNDWCWIIPILSDFPFLSPLLPFFAFFKCACKCVLVGVWSCTSWQVCRGHTL